MFNDLAASSHLSTRNSQLLLSREAEANGIWRIERVKRKSRGENRVFADHRS
jgi:hypothetical protein